MSVVCVVPDGSELTGPVKVTIGGVVSGGAGVGVITGAGGGDPLPPPPPPPPPPLPPPPVAGVPDVLGAVAVVVPVVEVVTSTPAAVIPPELGVAMTTGAAVVVTEVGVVAVVAVLESVLLMSARVAGPTTPTGLRLLAVW